MLNNNDLMSTQHAQCIFTIFITGGKFRLVSNFKLHTLNLAAALDSALIIRSCVR